MKQKAFNKPPELVAKGVKGNFTIPSNNPRKGKEKTN